MNERRKVLKGGYPSAVPYWRAVVKSILRVTSGVGLSLGTVTRPECESFLSLDSNRWGRATFASRVS